MIEIALCLAIIGFALVAIIGVLPTGMGVQKDNREETIIDQDAAVWMDAIRNGAQDYNDLTNYIVAITNFWTTYNVTPAFTNRSASGMDWYTSLPAPSQYSSRVTSMTGRADNDYPLTNGTHIIGLLSTPTYNPRPPLVGDKLAFTSNYVVAIVRSISGPAVEKPPQTDSVRDDMAFTYRMIVQNLPYVPVQPRVPADVTPLMATLWTNSHDFRLTFRYPLLPRSTGNGRQTFRMLLGGHLVLTNDNVVANQPIYFFDPTTYVQVQ
jgi:hypothetical protein